MQQSTAPCPTGMENITRLLVFTCSKAAGQVKILLFLVNFFIYANTFCDAGQVLF